MCVQSDFQHLYAASPQDNSLKVTVTLRSSRKMWNLLIKSYWFFWLDIVRLEVDLCGTPRVLGHRTDKPSECYSILRVKGNW